MNGRGNSSSTRENVEEEGGIVSTLVTVGAAVGAAAVALWSLSTLFGSSEEEKEKMMKAPGRNYSIPRKDFEKDPAEWFRSHR